MGSPGWLTPQFTGRTGAIVGPRRRHPHVDDGNVRYFAVNSLTELVCIADRRDDVATAP